MKKFIQFGALIVLASLAVSLQAGQSIDKTLPAVKGGNVTIENMRGKIEIIGWDRDEVKIVGELDDEAERLEFRDSGKHIEALVVMPKYKGSHHWQGGGSSLVIYVPKESHVNFEGISTDISAVDIIESVELKNISGNIKAENLASRVDINSVSGNLTTDNVSGKISLSTVSGNIKDKNSSGRLSVSSVSGNISVKSSASDISAKAVSGDIELSLGEVDDVLVGTISGRQNMVLTLNTGAKVKSSTVSGNVDIEMEGGVNATFALQATAGGRIVNNISDDVAVKAKYSPGAKLYFEQGKGNAQIDVNTVSGRIKISD